MEFVMNHILWSVYYVEPYDPRLIDRTGVGKLATTDPSSCHIYLSIELVNDPIKLRQVLLHELGHCVMISYGLIGTLHKYVKRRYWFEAEEELCNFIANYSDMVQDIAGYLSLN